MLNKIEQLFKDRFKNKTSTQGVYADELWASIASELDKKTLITKSKTPLWGLLFLLFFIPISSFFYYYKHQVATYNQEKKVPSHVSKNKEIAQNTPFSIQNIVPQTTFNTDGKKGTQMAAIVQDTSKKIFSISSDKKTNPINSKHTGFASYKQESASKNTGVSSFQATQKKHLNSNNSTVKNILFSAKEQNYNINIDLNTHNDAIQSISRKNTIAQTLVSLVFLPTQSSLPKTGLSNHSSYKNNALIRKSTKRLFEIGLLASLNTIYTQYQTANNSELAAKLPQVLSNNIGHSYTLSLSYLLGKNYSINSGLEYEFTQSILNINRQRDTTALDSNNILRNAIETRKVVHHNKFKAISIPLSFGVKKQFAKMNIGLNAGVSYNFFVSQKGKTINGQQNIIAFDGQSQTVTPFKSSFFAFQLNPFIDFIANDRLNFRFSTSFKYEPQGKSNLYGLKQYSFFIGMGGGVVFKI